MDNSSLLEEISWQKRDWKKFVNQIHTRDNQLNEIRKHENELHQTKPAKIQTPIDPVGHPSIEITESHKKFIYLLQTINNLEQTIDQTRKELAYVESRENKKKARLITVTAILLCLVVVFSALALNQKAGGNSISASNTINNSSSQSSNSGISSAGNSDGIVLSNSNNSSSNGTSNTSGSNNLVIKPTNPPNTGKWNPCSGTYTSRLHQGINARVINNGVSNRVRKGGSKDYAVIGNILSGEEIEILDDKPSCANGWVWWHIRSMKTGLEGWTSEGDSDGYWLEPLY